MTNYRILVVLLMAALLFGCSNRQTVEDNKNEAPPQWGPTDGGRSAIPADEAREVVPFHKERVESLRELNGEDRDADDEFVPLDTADEYFELNKAARENRPGTVENRIVTLIQKTNDERAKIEQLADNGADPTIMAKLRAHLEIGFNAVAAAGKLCETHGITYYPEIHRLQGEFLVALLLADEILKEDHPTEYTQIDSIKVTRKEATENLSDWYPAYKVFGLEYVAIQEVGPENDNLTVAVRFRSTPYATTMYITYLETREDIVRVEWTTMELFKNPLINPDEGHEGDEGDHADEEDHRLCPPLPEPGAEDDGTPDDDSSKSTADRLIDEALSLTSTPDDARKPILPEGAATVFKGQSPWGYRFNEGGAEQVDISQALNVLAAEAREIRNKAEDTELREIFYDHPTVVALDVLQIEDVAVRLTENQTRILAAICIVLLDDTRMAKNDFTKMAIRNKALNLLSGLADRRFGNFSYYYNLEGEALEKQTRHEIRCRRDWHRWWSVAAEAPLSDWPTIELPPIPEGVETALDAEEREAERIEAERRAEEFRYMRANFDIRSQLEEVHAALTRYMEPKLEEALTTVQEAAKAIKAFTDFVENAPADLKDEREGALRSLEQKLEEMLKLCEAFKSPPTKLEDVEHEDQLLGMRLQVPKEIRTQPGQMWDMHLDMMKEYGMEDPATGEEVTGDAVLPLFIKRNGERPEDIPAPSDNEDRITTAQLDEFAESNLEATDGVRIWWPGSVGTTDYWEKRLNIHVNEFGIITRVQWG